MAQATTASPPRFGDIGDPVPPPERYGSAFSAIYKVAVSLPNDQRHKLLDEFHTLTCREHEIEIYHAALARLNEVLGLLGVEEREDDPAVDVAFAMLARDRGLITAGDFDTLTAAWVAAGLPLPAASTGDEDTDVPVAKMTTDRVCDELVHTAHGTPHVGAVLVLTGFNHGELLTYDIVRGFVVKTDNGLEVRWADLDYALHEEGQFPPAGILSGEALGFLALAVSMATLPSAAPAGSANAEVMTLACAYALGSEYMIDPWYDSDVPRPATAPPRPASDPGE